MAGRADRPVSLAVWKFASCDGCQLRLLDLSDDLMSLTEKVHFAQFAELTRASAPGPYDVSVVEGSISTPIDAQRIRAVRALSDKLVTVGACASAGGIQSLRNSAAPGSYPPLVYAHPEYIESLATVTPVAAHVAVDFELRGCPVDAGQVLEVLSALVARRRPNIPTYSVCRQCKELGNACVLVSGDEPCLGPVTQAGCGALCPSVGRGCFGCFGPAESPNVPSLAAQLRRRGSSSRRIVRLLRSFNAAAPAFAQGALDEERGR